MTKTRMEERWKHLNGHIYKTPPLLIHASPEMVWQHVIDIKNYEIYSKKVVRGHVDGKPEAGKKIILTLPALGKILQTSEEKISIVDHDKKVIGWERVLPGGSVTERYQWLEETAEGETLSHIALSIPGWSGFFTKVFKNTIEHAFDSINQGIKQASELEMEQPGLENKRR